jgi:TolB-like protein/DNA-binding winged helix-turn-helix (wHTH) protein/Tfp pilus assembly protein PilF
LAVPNPSQQLRLVKFGLFEADMAARELRKQGQKIKLQERPFDILAIFLVRPLEVITREEFREKLWPADTFVAFDPSLNTSINKLRAALSDDADNPRFIETVGRRGYRFIAPTTCEYTDAAPTTAPSPTDEPRSPIPAAPPRARVAMPAIILSVAAIALAVCAGYLAWRHYRPVRAAGSTRVMLAVLPFQNLTGDSDQDYFADGVTEEITTQLGRLDPAQLGVIARTSTSTYKGSDKSLAQIGRELSVEYVLEGSFRRAGDRVRVTAQLIRVNDQSHVWAQDYDRSPQDVLTVEDDVAESVAREIQVRLSPEQLSEITRHRSVDPQAQEDYLRGRYFWNLRTEDGFRKAATYFNAAIARDPNYAEAYAGLADTDVLLGGYGLIPQRIAMPNAKAAALKAIAIDDRLAAPYVPLALVLEEYEWNWKDAETNYRRAIELAPNYSVAHHFYADGYLALVGRDQEAIKELRIAHALDPLSLIIDTDLAKRLCFAGKHDEAIEEFGKVLEADPNFVQAHLVLSQCYAKERSFPQAIAEIEKVGDLSNHLEAEGWLGYLYAASGRKSEALQIAEGLAQKAETSNIDPGQIAYIYIALSQNDQAFACLHKAMDRKSSSVLSLKSSWIFDPIRPDPRFAALLQQTGLS